MDRILTTTGVGQAAGTPDAMRLSLAVVARAASVSEALAGTSSGVSAAAEVSRRHTSDDLVRSTGMHVWQAFDSDGRPAGYECRHQLSVHCPDLVRAGELVTALGELEGRVLVDSVEPVIADPTPLAVTARERAWADARRKAEELATLAGSALGAVVSVVEGGSPVRPLRAEAVAVQDAMPFEPGSQSVTATLTVTWELVPPAG